MMPHSVVFLLFLLLSIVARGQQPRLILPVGHSGSMSAVEYSPNGKNILTASYDGTAKIWDAGSGKLLIDINGQSSGVNAVAFGINAACFSRDGKRMFAACSDSITRVWDPYSNKLLFTLVGHKNQVTDVCISPDGLTIITFSYDNTAKIWEATTGKLLFDISINTEFKNNAVFTPDSKKVIIGTADSTIMVWDILTGKSVKKLSLHTGGVNIVSLSSDGTRIASSSDDSTTRIWNLINGELLSSFKHNGKVNDARFSLDGKQIVTACNDSLAYHWNIETGQLIRTLAGHTSELTKADFSPDGTRVITATWGDDEAKLWDVKSGQLISELEGWGAVNCMNFSPDGKNLIIGYGTTEGRARVFSLKTGKPLTTLRGYTRFVSSLLYFPDDKKFISVGFHPFIWDAVTGRLLTEIKSDAYSTKNLTISADGKKMATAPQYDDPQIWDTESGKLLFQLKGHNGDIANLSFSEDGKFLISASYDGTAKIWNIQNGRMILSLRVMENRNNYNELDRSGVRSAIFLRGSAKVLTISSEGKGQVWDARTGKLLVVLKGIITSVTGNSFSTDGKKLIAMKDFEDKIGTWDLVTGRVLSEIDITDSYSPNMEFSPRSNLILMYQSSDTAVSVWNAGTGKVQAILAGHSYSIKSAQFSSDGMQIITTAEHDNVVKIWESHSGKLIFELPGYTDRVTSAVFSHDGSRLITSCADGSIKLWNARTGIPLYTIIRTDENDYLAVDKDFHFDGSEGARKMLYLVCGTEVIDLEQVKEKLWVPNLAERIGKGESINAPTLGELDICGFAPLVNTLDDTANGYHFTILPRRGGLGETALYINGIQVKRYQKKELAKKGEEFELLVKYEELLDFLIPKQENLVAVKAWVADNTISSRGVHILAKDTGINVIHRPNLYAVMVGVSDYKGDQLDLKYAAKDAVDLGAVLKTSARKLFNTDGQEHVFVYNLTTSSGYYHLPEKSAIKKMLEEIGKQAKSNDILLIFFAGHGQMSGKENKQFYFLTADASERSALDAIADVGISTAELTEWIKPGNINAQKRILIFDACNSGQAIRDFVQLGKPEQEYMAARNDEKGQQIKAIERLNNQSGLIILAASASDQNAYEMSRYSQGLLTYSLLKVLKQQPEILDDGQYLDVGNWLNEAKKLVFKLAEATGARQEPQLNTNNNFNIGLVDNEVRNTIILAAEKPLFTQSNFQNKSIPADNLKLSMAIDKKLQEEASETTGAITFSRNYEEEKAFQLSGNYTVQGDEMIITVLLIKDNTEFRRFEIRGKMAEKDQLARSIVVNALKMMTTKVK